jgi:hypothetical protein
MGWQILAGPLLDLGLGTLGKLVGGKSGAVVETVGRGIAEALGVSTPEEARQQIAADPAAAGALRELQADRADEYLQLAVAELDFARALAADEATRGFFHNGWRPALSWLVVAIIFNQFLAGAALRAVAGIDITAPYEQVLGIAGIWLTIYGGGHTAKAIFAGRGGTPA